MLYHYISLVHTLYHCYITILTLSHKVVARLQTSHFIFSPSFLAAPCIMGTLSSPARDRTCAPAWEHCILTTGWPGESHFTSLQASISSLEKLGNHFRVLPLFSSQD